MSIDKVRKAILDSIDISPARFSKLTRRHVKGCRGEGLLKKNKTRICSVYGIKRRYIGHRKKPFVWSSKRKIHLVIRSTQALLFLCCLPYRVSQRILPFFWKIRVFAKISWFCGRIGKFFHLKALQTRMQINVNKFFVAQVVPEIYAKNTSFKIS